ncbi:hypothetical protein BC829DRAFT_422327 [Chytridium lagenaria]|nr:hypothetical protein BC829DRAFT_422327 [Chytridium lagenaria]
MVEDDDDDILVSAESIISGTPVITNVNAAGAPIAVKQDVTNQKMTAFRQTKKAKVTEEKLKKEKVLSVIRVKEESGRKRIKWTDKQSEFLLEAMVKEKQLGKGTDGRIMVDLNANFCLEYSVEQIKSHFNQMWKPRYSAIKSLRNSSGFGCAGQRMGKLVKAHGRSEEESLPLGQRGKQPHCFITNLEAFLDGQVATGQDAIVLNDDDDLYFRNELSSDNDETTSKDISTGKEFSTGRSAISTPAMSRYRKSRSRTSSGTPAVSNASSVSGTPAASKASSVRVNATVSSDEDESSIEDSGHKRKREKTSDTGHRKKRSEKASIAMALTSLAQTVGDIVASRKAHSNRRLNRLIS